MYMHVPSFQNYTGQGNVNSIDNKKYTETTHFAQCGVNIYSMAISTFIDHVHIRFGIIWMNNPQFVMIYLAKVQKC